MNLTVPRDRLFEQPDGSWWFVVEGERTLCPTTHADLRRRNLERCPDCAGGSGYRVSSPADLVALAAPCETFHYENNCPNCPTLTIETECDSPMISVEREWHDELCCDGSGTVSLGPFRIETPVPIVGSSAQQDIHGEHANGYVRASHLHAYHHFPSWDQAPINLGPDPAQFVGWYAVKAVVTA